MNLVQGVKLGLAPLAWRALAATFRLSPPPQPPSRNVIYACLHRDILPAIAWVRPARPVLMVSDSPDGDILVRTLGEEQYGFVRGSSEEHGGRALVALCRALEAGRCAGVAVDGPKGPFGVVRDGVIHLSRRTGVPIVPLRAETAGAVTLGTWDRTCVPLPGARVRIVAGDPVVVPRDAGDATIAHVRRRLLEHFLPGGGAR